MAERPAAARSRSVGRCHLVVELAKSHLGSLWVATEPSAAGLEPRLVRCLAPGGITPDDREALAEAGRWSGGFEVEQAASTLEVVVDGSELAFVSAYGPGETLRSLLRLANIKRTPLPTRVALRVIVDVCEALLAAESRAGSAPAGPASLWGGLLPDSILVGVDGTTRVLDLGVASLWRQRSSEAQHPEVTSYCAPEQLDQAIVDARADVFILGILWWEMLSGGKRLFTGSSQRAVVERLRKHEVAAAGSDLPADTVDPATRALLNKMLSPDPGSRFDGIRELKQALDAIGDAAALPREVSDFVTSVASSALESRERVLGRTLERSADRIVQAAVLPPRLPLAIPAEVTWLAAVDDGIEIEETGSVRAEDIIAALAVEDVEPESDDAPGLRIPDPAPVVDVVDSTVAAAPPSSGRRASPTAVVVPSVIAAPDPEAFAPGPSVLQTLRGPGIPPPTFDLLPPMELLSDTKSAVAEPAPLVETAATEPAQALRSASASASVLGRHTPARGLSRLLDQRRLPVPMVAALSGAAFVVVLGLVFALGGDDTESSAERGPEVMGARTSDSDQVGSQLPGQTPGGAARAGAPAVKPARADAETAENGDRARDAAKGESATAVDDSPAQSTAAPPAEPATAGPATLEQVSVVPRATPTRARSKRSSGTVRTTAKKKKLRATRTYIPAGI